MSDFESGTQQESIELPRLEGDVVELVRRLGSDAVNEFLDGLSPHLTAIESSDPVASANLAAYLYECKLSAVVILQAGGIEAMQEKGRIAAQAPAETPEQAIAKLHQAFPEVFTEAQS